MECRKSANINFYVLPCQPDFYNWNRVKLRYCDGASFAGDSIFDNGVLLFNKKLPFITIYLRTVATTPKLYFSILVFLLKFTQIAKLWTYLVFPFMLIRFPLETLWKISICVGAVVLVLTPVGTVTSTSECPLQVNAVLGRTRRRTVETTWNQLVSEYHFKAPTILSCSFCIV